MLYLSDVLCRVWTLSLQDAVCNDSMFVCRVCKSLLLNYLRQRILPASVCLSVCLSVSKITQKRVHGFGWNVACRQMSEHGRTWYRHMPAERLVCYVILPQISFSTGLYLVFTNKVDYVNAGFSKPWAPSTRVLNVPTIWSFFTSYKLRAPHSREPGRCSTQRPP